MRFARALLSVTALASLAAVGSAQSASFFFTSKGSSTLINEVNIGQGVGSQVDLSVWAKVTGTFNFSVASVFLKYDTTTAGDPLGKVYSTPPTLQNNKIRVAGGPAGITGRNSVFTGGDSVYANAPGTSPYNFGMDTRYFIGGGGSTTATTALRLFDVRLENAGLAAGQSYVISLLNRGAGTNEYSTYLQANSGTILNTNTTNFTVKSVVPEPGTFVAIVAGLVFLARRRRRTAN